MEKECYEVDVPLYGQYTEDIHHELARYHIYWPALSHFYGC